MHRDAENCVEQATINIKKMENSAQETPSMKCLREAQEAHTACLSKAKTPEEKSTCNAALTKAINACPAPSPGEA